MRIINTSKNSTLATNAVLADSFLKRIIGLIGKSGLQEKEALVIPFCSSIHTFFMSFPIDVLFVDQQKRVIRVVESLKPWRIPRVCFRSNLVIELPTGIIKSTATCPGDRLSIS